MFYRLGLIISILFCAIQLQTATALAQGPPLNVLVVPFALQGTGDLAAARRNIMNTFAVSLQTAGAKIVGIAELRDAMLKAGVSQFTEAAAFELGAAVKADYAIMGAIESQGGAIGVEWRLIELASKGTVAAYAKSSPSEAGVLTELRKSAQSIYSKMISVSSARPAVKTGVISRIEVSGTRRIDKEAVLKKTLSKAGQPFSIDDVREDIRSIYATGYFDDVSADLSDTASGKTLTFIIKEMPFIKKIAFKGNSEIKDDKLKESVTIKENTVLDRPLLEYNAEKIKGVYAEDGYYLTTVRPVLDSDGVETTVTFEINEGPEVKVKRIVVIGTDHFDEDDIKGFMDTDEKGIFSSVTDSGKFDEQKFENDLAVIMGKYYDEGYISAEVIDHRVTLSEDKKWFFISIAIYEGVQYSIGEISVAGDILTTKEELIDKLKLEAGDLFNRTQFSKGLDAINDVYGDKGYAYADVKPITNLDADKKLVNIILDIKKNELTYIERVDITGNTMTRDKVIRREIELGEGELFSSSALKRSRNNLKRLGYFEDVQIKDSQGTGPDKLNLNVGVVEKPTGSVSIGVGYSSVDKLVGTASLSQTNFKGTGIKLDVSGSISASSTKYVIGVTEPWLFDMPLSAGFDLYNTEKEYSNYKLTKKGFDVRLGFPVADRYTYGFLTYKFEEVLVDNVTAGAPTFIKDQEGKANEASLKAAIKRDTRDDAFFPTEGAVVNISTEVAGRIFGGTKDYVRYETDNIKFFPLPLDTTVSVRGNLGYIEGYSGHQVPIYERYYLGGINSLRGFRTRTVGPKDRATGEVIGGKSMALASLEFLFPLLKEQGFRGLVFFDIGNAYESRIDLGDLRKSAGAGVRWYSPIGPLRFEYGINLDQRGDEKDHQWEFTVGTNF